MQKKIIHFVYYEPIKDFIQITASQAKMFKTKQEYEVTIDEYKTFNVTCIYYKVKTKTNISI